MCSFNFFLSFVSFFLHYHFFHFLFSSPLLEYQCCNLKKNTLENNLQIEIGNYELLVPSRKYHSLLLLVDNLIGTVFSLLFITLDQQITKQKKIYHVALLLSILVIPSCILAYHLFIDVDLEVAERLLRLTLGSWNGQACGRIDQGDVNRRKCGITVTQEQVDAYKFGEHVFLNMKETAIWLPKSVLPLSMCLAFILTLQFVAFEARSQCIFKFKGLAIFVSSCIIVFPLCFIVAMNHHRIEGRCEKIVASLHKERRIMSLLEQMKLINRKSFQVLNEKMNEVQGNLSILSQKNDDLASLVKNNHEILMKAIKNMTEYPMPSNGGIHPVMTDTIDHFLNGIIIKEHIPLGFTFQRFFLDSSHHRVSNTDVSSTAKGYLYCMERGTSLPLFIRNWYDQTDIYVIPLSLTPMFSMVIFLIILIAMFGIRLRTKSSNLISIIVGCILLMLLIAFLWCLEVSLYDDACSKVDENGLTSESSDVNSFPTISNECHENNSITGEKEEVFGKLELERMKDRISVAKEKRPWKLRWLYLLPFLVMWLSFAMVKITGYGIC